MDLLQDAFILLSVANTKLRDEYSSLEDLCASEGVAVDGLLGKLAEIGYAYDRGVNAFKRS